MTRHINYMLKKKPHCVHRFPPKSARLYSHNHAEQLVPSHPLLLPHGSNSSIHAYLGPVFVSRYLNTEFKTEEMAQQVKYWP